MIKAYLRSQNQMNEKKARIQTASQTTVTNPQLVKFKVPLMGFIRWTWQPSICSGVLGTNTDSKASHTHYETSSDDCCRVAPLLFRQSHVDNISTITTHLSLWYRHIQNALGKMPITEMLFSVALFKWVSHRCHRSAQLSEFGSKGSSKSISLLSYHPAWLNHSKGKPFWVMWPFLYRVLPKTACHKPI